MKLCKKHDAELFACIKAANLEPFCSADITELKRRGLDFVEKRRWTKENFEPALIANGAILYNYTDAVKGTGGTAPLDPSLLKDMADGARRCPICTLEDHWGPRPPDVPSWTSLATGAAAELARELGLI